MKKLFIFLFTVLLICSVGFLYLAKPPLPPEWKTLRIGDSMETIKSKIPDLKQYDETMFTASYDTKHWGIQYSWGGYFHFDRNERLIRMEGRSRNDWLGLLDRKFNY